MKTYLEISVSANQEQRDLLIPPMIELGCKGFQETDTALLCYIDKSQWDENKYQLFERQLKSILQTISANASIQFSEMQDKDWNEEWEKTIQPIEIGKRFVIKPSWSEYTNKDNRIIIQIDPKMSFGTGYHETTRLTLLLIEKYINSGDSVLDVGTGTGILAIAAVKLGASYALGIDNDEWSIDNAKENVLANHVEEKLLISSYTLNELPSSRYNLIAANLTLNMNVDFLNEFKRVLKSTGTLLLSGLLSSDQEIIISTLTRNNFGVIEIITENEWIAIAARAIL